MAAAASSLSATDGTATARMKREGSIDVDRVLYMGLYETIPLATVGVVRCGHRFLAFPPRRFAVAHTHTDAEPGVSLQFRQPHTITEGHHRLTGGCPLLNGSPLVFRSAPSRRKTKE